MLFNIEAFYIQHNLDLFFYLLEGIFRICYSLTADSADSWYCKTSKNKVSAWRSIFIDVSFWCSVSFDCCLMINNIVFQKCRHYGCVHVTSWHQMPCDFVASWCSEDWTWSAHCKWYIVPLLRSLLYHSRAYLDISLLFKMVVNY